MEVVETESWLEEIPPVGCQRHLAQETFGRVAVLVDGWPQVFPVNYAMDGDDVVFRTDPGTKLHAVDETSCVSFEIDGVDHERKTGWSVQVLGRARLVRSPEHLERLQQLPLEPWAHGEKSNFVRIIPMHTTGRRIHSAGVRRGPKA